MVVISLQISAHPEPEDDAEHGKCPLLFLALPPV